MSITALIVLIALSLILMIVEILVVPGGILGISSLLLMAYGIYSSYAEYGATTGHIFFGVTLVATIFLLVFLFKSGAWKFIAHKGELKGKANSHHEFQAQKGRRGISVSMLRPSGSAIFDGEKIEVCTEGEPVPANVEIEITGSRDSRIIVKRVD